MGRPQATRLKDKKVYCFEIGYCDANLVLVQDMEATMIIPEYDYLRVFNLVDGLERQIAIFRDWKYYKMKSKDPISECQT
jgi:hypothetical protein